MNISLILAVLSDTCREEGIGDCNAGLMSLKANINFNTISLATLSESSLANIKPYSGNLLLYRLHAWCATVFRSITKKVVEKLKLLFSFFSMQVFVNILNVFFLFFLPLSHALLLFSGTFECRFGQRCRCWKLLIGKLI